MAKFGELQERYDPGLTLTVKGAEYVLPLPSAELGLWCRALTESMGLAQHADADQMQAAVDRMEKLPEPPGGISFQEWLLGPVYGRMVSDGVEHHYIQFCAFAAFMWVAMGEEAAQVWWEAGGDPEAMGPDNRAQRRAVQRAGTRTDAATATRSPASMSGTTSPRRRGHRKGRSSPGTT